MHISRPIDGLEASVSLSGWSVDNFDVNRMRSLPCFEVNGTFRIDDQNATVHVSLNEGQQISVLYAYRCPLSKRLLLSVYVDDKVRRRFHPSITSHTKDAVEFRGRVDEVWTYRDKQYKAARMWAKRPSRNALSAITANALNQAFGVIRVEAELEDVDEKAFIPLANTPLTGRTFREDANLARKLHNAHPSVSLPPDIHASLEPYRPMSEDEINEAKDMIDHGTRAGTLVSSVNLFYRTSDLYFAAGCRFQRTAVELPPLYSTHFSTKAAEVDAPVKSLMSSKAAHQSSNNPSDSAPHAVEVDARLKDLMSVKASAPHINQSLRSGTVYYCMDANPDPGLMPRPTPEPAPEDQETQEIQELDERVNDLRQKHRRLRQMRQSWHDIERQRRLDEQLWMTIEPRLKEQVETIGRCELSKEIWADLVRLLVEGEAAQHRERWGRNTHLPPFESTLFAHLTHERMEQRALRLEQIKAGTAAILAKYPLLKFTIESSVNLANRISVGLDARWFEWESRSAYLKEAMEATRASRRELSAEAERPLSAYD